MCLNYCYRQRPDDDDFGRPLSAINKLANYTLTVAVRKRKHGRGVSAPYTTRCLIAELK